MCNTYVYIIHITYNTYIIICIYIHIYINNLIVYYIHMYNTCHICIFYMYILHMYISYMMLVYAQSQVIFLLVSLLFLTYVLFFLKPMLRSSRVGITASF